MAEKRRIVLVTSLGKKYVGNVDIPNTSLRTTDLLNSNSVFWKDPSERASTTAQTKEESKRGVLIWKN